MSKLRFRFNIFSVNCNFKFNLGLRCWPPFGAYQGSFTQSHKNSTRNCKSTCAANLDCNPPLAKGQRLGRAFTANEARGAGLNPCYSSWFINASQQPSEPLLPLCLQMSAATDSPIAPGSRDAVRVAPRSSLVDSLRGCGLSGVRIDKQQLNSRIVIPQYLRVAVVQAIRTKDPSAAAEAARGSGASAATAAPEAPLVVFVNSRSGGRLGSTLKERLQELISEEQVFDLSVVKPPDLVQFGLVCLEKLATFGDQCAKETREKLRIVVAGGDGTVGWVLGTIAELYKLNRVPVPPVGIIPLGTGNDLARSFGWGGSFPYGWRSAVKRSLYDAVTGPIRPLDSWHMTVTMPAGQTVQLPHCLRQLEERSSGQNGDIEGDFPEKVSCIEGVFYNYFSVGMDAQIAYGFHHLRDEKPHLARGPIANKLIYSGYTCTQGWFCTPCTSSPKLRGLNSILRMQIRRVSSSEWEQIQIPSSVRSIVALNLHNYGSGRNPWGKPKPDYLEKRGFVEAHVDDGLLEIFGLKQAWHASFVMVELITAKHMAQAAAIKMEFRSGQCQRTYMQMDGEPWKQPISSEHSTIVEFKRMPYQSLMISVE